MDRYNNEQRIFNFFRWQHCVIFISEIIQTFTIIASLIIILYAFVFFCGLCFSIRTVICLFIWPTNSLLKSSQAAFYTLWFLSLILSSKFRNNWYTSVAKAIENIETMTQQISHTYGTLCYSFKIRPAPQAKQTDTTTRTDNSSFHEQLTKKKEHHLPSNGTWCWIKKQKEHPMN